MIASATANLSLLSEALTLRAERQRVIASNIANADTPGYAAREFNFGEALQQATAGPSTGAGAGSALLVTHSRHQALASAGPGGTAMGYEATTQPSVDGNSVDLDRERAKFTDNAIRYESTLRFINSHVKTMLSAIQGQ